MLKNKLTIITILFVIILTLTLPIVRAENQTDENTASEVTLTSENAVTDETSDPTEDPANSDSTTTANITDENFKKGDVYILKGEDVTIDYIIDGNLFVIANNVTITSQIGGDAFICANSITVEEQGYVFSNLFALSNNVTINGVVYDLYSLSQNTTINGYVYRDIRVSSNNVNIFGVIGRNAYVKCSNINFENNTNTNSENQESITLQGTITGDLNYSSAQEANIPEGSITGNINFEPKTISDTDNNIQEYIIYFGSFVTTIVIVWLLCLWFKPKFLNNTTTFLTTKKAIPTIGIGILTPIVAVVLSALLLILGLTYTLGLLLLGILLILIAISTAIFVITLNKFICDKLKIQKTIGIFGILILSSIVLWLIGLIPFVGTITGFIATTMGLGIIVSSLILKEKKEDKVEEEIVNEKIDEEK